MILTASFFPDHAFLLHRILQLKLIAAKKFASQKFVKMSRCV